jgi:proprotein convertase subtilisin/kexin type 5
VTTSTKCLSCALISTSQSYLYTDNSCYTTCPTGSYATSTNGVYLCTACPTGCTTCSLVSGSVQCTICASVSSINFYLSGTSCVQNCPAGKYNGVDGSSNPICITCDSPCATCNAAGTSACLSCSAGNLIYGTNTCGSCAATTYADTPSTCAPCDANCATCQTTATHCLTCGLLGGTQSYLYSDNKCYTACPTGSYADTSSGFLCTVCPTGCAQCSYVTSSVQCTLCTAVAGVQYYLSSTSCTSDCGNGFYGSTGNPTCIACSAPCTNCLSASACLSCSTGYLVYGGTTCPASCPTGQFSDSASTCALCNSNCLTCATSSTHCLSCGILSGAQSYLYSDNICYINCPTATFKRISDNSCQDCDSSCNGCIDTTTNCIACSTSGSNYFRVIGSTACTQNCGNGYYGDTGTLTCTACPIGCSLCSMTSSILSCSKCNSFAGVQYYLSGNQCVSLCAVGTYQGIDSGNNLTTCINCTGSCSTCAGSGSYCTSCSSGNLIVGQNTCGSCPAGQWADTSSTCAYCSPNCKTCSGTSSTCTACAFTSLGYQLFLHSDNICY